MADSAISVGDIEVTHRHHNGLALPPRDILQQVEVLRGGWGDWGSNRGMSRKIPLLLHHLEAALGTDYTKPPQGKALIFVKTRRAAEELGTTVADQFGLERCGVMHGLRGQDQRENTLRAFREGRIHALVATDVLGRGVDIPDVSHVVIFDFPDDIETYVHRVGRTGRNGRPGTSVAFFEPQPWAPDLARELVEVLLACGQDVPNELNAELEHNVGFGGGGPGVKAAGEASHSKREPPPLEDMGSPVLATKEEVGAWDAGGARVWSYSANGGATEQGRLELRAGGLLRTTWGWGDWSLVDMQPLEGETPPTCLAITWGGVTDIVSLDVGGLSFELVSRNGRPAHTFRKKTVGHALPNTSL